MASINGRWGLIHAYSVCHQWHIRATRPVRGVGEYVDNVATNLLRLYELSMRDVLVLCLLRSQAN